MILWQVGDVRHPLAPPADSSFYTWLAFSTEVAKLYAQYRAIYKSDFVEETEVSPSSQPIEAAGGTGSGGQQTAATGSQSQSGTSTPSSTSISSTPPVSFAAACARLQPASLTTVFARFPIDNCDLWCEAHDKQFEHCSFLIIS